MAVAARKAAASRQGHPASPPESEPPKWPADAVERRPVADLTPYARNARTHSAAQVDEIVASIREWGWTVPVVVDEEGGIIAGHGRVMAAVKMGLTEVPVVVARGWTEVQKRTYILADNKLGLNSGWDGQLLAIEMSDLKSLDANLGLAGFSEREITRTLRSLETGAETGQLGDLEFRVVVDCTSEEHQAELLQRLKREGLKCRALIS